MSDFQFATVTINGIDTPVLARYEYTTYEVGLAYNQYLQSIGDVFKLKSTLDTNGMPVPATLTPEDAQDVWTALNSLFVLAKDGLNGAYLNTEMARNLDELSSSFKAVGFTLPPGVFGAIPPQSPSPALDTLFAALKAWKDLSILSPVITEIISKGLSAYTTNRSLQALMELEYVKTANDLVETKLGELENALTNTNGILNTLAAIQDIHNLLTVTSKGTFNFDFMTLHDSKSKYVASYQKAASAYFGDPVLAQIPKDIILASYRISQNFLRESIRMDGFTGVTVTIFQPVAIFINSLTPKGVSVVNQLLVLRASIVAQLAKLSGILSATQRLGTGSLYSQLKSVLADFDTTFSVTEASTLIEKRDALSAWLVDKYNDKDSSDSGKIQGNITKAITAAQSLNDTQKEEVRNYMFVFEEYYKSASAILQKITQIIERIAQGIRS